MYGDNTVYVVGNSKTNADNAITDKFNSFFIGFVVDTVSDKIIDLSCSSTIRTTEEFIISLFTGKSLKEFDPKFEDEIKRRYHGSSQRAVIVAYKDAVTQYNKIKVKYF